MVRCTLCHEVGSARWMHHHQACCGALPKQVKRSLKVRDARVQEYGHQKLHAAVNIQRMTRGWMARMNMRSKWLIRHQMAKKVQDVFREYLKGILNGGPRRKERSVKGSVKALRWPTDIIAVENAITLARIKREEEWQQELEDEKLLRIQDEERERMFS